MNEGETVVARLRPHSRALFWPTLLLLAVAAALGFLSGAFREPWQNAVLLGAGGAAALLGWLVPVLRWSARRYTITSRRVIVSSGILARTRRDVPHSRITDVAVERRGLQAVFRSGDVVINDDIVLADVPSAGLVQAAIHDLADATFPSFPSAMVHP